MVKALRICYNKKIISLQNKRVVKVKYEQEVVRWNR